MSLALALISPRLTQTEIMPSKHLYIHTIGCQMNVYDSERMAMDLASLGYIPALSAEDADLVIVNTCSVRDKAEQKAFSILGRLEASSAAGRASSSGWPVVSRSRKASGS